MSFSAKQYVADLKLEPMPFEDMDGIWHDLPHLGLMNAEEAENVLSLLRTDPKAGIEAIAPGAAEAISKLPIRALAALATAWMDHCQKDGAGDLGESGASSSSTGSTARPSKRTSPATTKARTRKR